MIEFFKKLFGSAVKVPAEAPYKIEAPVVQTQVDQFPFPAPADKPAKAAKPKAEKKLAAKKTTTRKPRAPKA